MNILVSISVFIVINKRSNLSVLTDGSSQIMGLSDHGSVNNSNLYVIVAQQLKYAQVCHENNF